MSQNWVKDIADMHAKFGVNPVVDKLNDEMFKEFIKLRIGMMQEELDEFKKAIEDKDPDGMVDALIDLAVFTIGTLDISGANPYKAWDEVYNANMVKSPGVKPGRPNPYGLPDLIKPAGWQAPTHEDNVGRFGQVYNPRAEV